MKLSMSIERLKSCQSNSLLYRSITEIIVESRTDLENESHAKRISLTSNVVSVKGYITIILFLSIIIL